MGDQGDTLNSMGTERVRMLDEEAGHIFGKEDEINASYDRGVLRTAEGCFGTDNCDENEFDDPLLLLKISLGELSGEDLECNKRTYLLSAEKRDDETLARALQFRVVVLEFLDKREEH